MGGGTGGSLGSEGLLTNICEMAGFLAVAADFSGSWAQVTKVSRLFAIPEKTGSVSRSFRGFWEAFVGERRCSIMELFFKSRGCQQLVCLLSRFK